ncbi:MAG: SDR family oxidoreductase [Peptostreptococcaceae bacterium]|nr:SDR family oxidoreductase [Peptostreptococcaceae bacterium]
MLNKMFEIRGKKGIVTGATRGLGKAMAQALYEAGVEIVIMGTSDRILSVAKEIDKTGTKVHGIIADFRDTLSVQNAFESAIAILGDLDILVNNAGMQIRHPSEDFPVEDWEAVLAVNLTAPFIMSKLAGKIMLEKGYGKIINIASVLSFIGGYTVPAYAASKGGIARMTQTMCNEWASKGINVNAIAPGYMETDNTTAIKNDPVRYNQLLTRIPTNRWGVPSDIVGPLLFLASSASDYVNGVILPVDGGFLGR